MRDGRVVIQESPGQLKERTLTANLDSAFLRPRGFRCGPGNGHSARTSAPGVLLLSSTVSRAVQRCWQPQLCQNPHSRQRRSGRAVRQRTRGCATVDPCAAPRVRQREWRRRPAASCVSCPPVVQWALPRQATTRPPAPCWRPRHVGGKPYWFSQAVTVLGLMLSMLGGMDPITDLPLSTVSKMGRFSDALLAGSATHTSRPPLRRERNA